jgi:uncharacterized protein (DUF58 family)
MALTRRAAIVALCGALVVFVAPLDGWMLLFVESALLLGIVFDLLMAGSVRALQVSRYGDTARRLDEPVSVGYLIVNRGARPVRGVARDAWPPSAQAAPSRQRVLVPPGERRRFSTSLTPLQRKELSADRVTVRSVGPLGLAARQGAHTASWRVRVLPAFPSRRRLPEKLAKLQLLDGRAAARIRGQGTEFDSLRDYVEGDDARSIDWRATARRTNVVVRTWRPERDRRLLLVLDTGRTSAGRMGDGTSLDVAIDAALLLGALAAKAGDRVSVLAADDRTRALPVDTASDNAVPSLLRSMAGLQPRLVETDARAMAAAVLRRAPHRSLVILFSSLDEAVVHEGLLPVLPSLTARHLVVVASVTDPVVADMAQRSADAREVYDAAAAAETLASTRRVSALLRRLGVEVVSAPPDEFAGAVADHYLGLKAAGRL